MYIFYGGRGEKSSVIFRGRKNKFVNVNFPSQSYFDLWDSNLHKKFRNRSGIIECFEFYPQRVHYLGTKSERHKKRSTRFDIFCEVNTFE